MKAEKMDFNEHQLQQEAAFADAHYSAYADQLALNPAMFKKYTDPRQMWDWRQFGARLLGKVEGQSLLDMGCGMGEESVYFALLGARVTAIDISPVGIMIAQKRAAFNGVAERVHAAQMRADKTEFADASFDVVHGFGILHHIGMPGGLQEVKRLLKPGGRALFFEHLGNSALIERIRKRSDYTDYETPLRWKDIMSFCQEFSRYEVRAFHVLTRLRSFGLKLNVNILRRCDHGLLTLCPPLKHFASGVVIYLEK